MDWRKYSPATCLPDCWCEAPRLGSFILEPVNSWTNLCFIFAGVYFLLVAKKPTSETNLLTTHPIYSQTYGVALVFLGIGSFFYHASQTFVGQWFDVFGMYLVSCFFVVYNMVRLQMIKQEKFFIFYMMTCVLLGVLIIFSPGARRWLFGFSLVIILWQIYLINKKKRSILNLKFLFISFMTYAVGQFFWILDKYKIWCDPFALMNGHGLWHLLTGISAISIFLYFSSEKTI